MKQPGLTAAAFVGALAGSAVLAFDSITALPTWLALVALALVLLGSGVAFATIWRDARSAGASWWRTAGQAAWDSLRLLLNLIFA